jgi:mitogen-activated protein kinase kinase
MLLQHAWLAPVAKPATIMEEDEEAAEAAAEADVATEPPSAVEEGFVDREVGEWVLGALDQRRRGVVGKAVKPALHAAPLDTAAAVANEVASPTVEK